MTAKKTGSKPSKTTSRARRQPTPPGADDRTRDAFRQALEAKNAKSAQRSGEDHLNGPGMNLHLSDKQQRTHRRKSG